MKINHRRLDSKSPLSSLPFDPFPHPLYAKSGVTFFFYLMVLHPLAPLVMTGDMALFHNQKCMKKIVP